MNSVSFEYKVCHLYATCSLCQESESEEVEYELNELGSMGWELVTMKLEEAHAVCVMKRKKQ